MKTSIYQIHISDFWAPESKSNLYPESRNFLRFFHPCFEDFVDISASELDQARGKSGKLVTTIQFERPKKVFWNQKNVHYPQWALFGVSMYCLTKNSADQLCIKPNGTLIPRLNLSEILNGELHLRRLKIESIHTIVELGTKREKVYVKGTIGELGIKKLSSNDFYYIQSSSSNALIREFKVFKAAMKKIIVESYKPAFQEFNIAVPQKITGYFSPQYMTNGGDVLPLSAYMIRSSMPSTVFPDFDEMQAALEAKIEDYPEMGGVKEFIRIAREYLDNPKLQDPSRGNTDIRRRWFLCMEIAIAITCMYNNSVPYLMDMENVGKRPSGPMTSSPFKPFEELGSRPKNYIDVERMFDAEKSYGHDCEDSAMNADLRKRSLNPEIIKIRNGGKTISQELRIVSEIYELFVCCVTAMFCGGNDSQSEKDDGIFHFCAVFIPRIYFMQMEMNGRVPRHACMKIPSNLRDWEYLYNTDVDEKGNFSGQIGVMYGEGTNTVSPAQFKYDPVVEQARLARAQFLHENYNYFHGMEDWLNVHHSNVYAQSDMHMSSFYKYFISCIVGDGNYRRRTGIYDYQFTMLDRRDNTYGVPVEALSKGNPNVALKPIFVYEEQEIKAIEMVSEFRTICYGSYKSHPALKRYLGTDTKLPFQISDFFDGPSYNPYTSNLDSALEKYQYIRLCPLEVDMHNGKRRNELIMNLRKVVTNSNTKVIAVKMNARKIKGIPMDPILLENPKVMETPTNLISLSILLFFELNSSNNIMSLINNYFSLK